MFGQHQASPMNGWTRQQKSAFQRASTTFARRHPAWYNSLFDAYFLTRQGLPLLNEMVEGARPKASSLAVLYTSQMQLSPKAREDSLPQATRIASTFLQLFQEELER